MATKYTSSNGEIIKGTQSDDQLYGGNQTDDTVYTGVTLNGYGGNDQLYASNMVSSSAYGAAGDDIIYGGGTSNKFYGGDDADTLYGGGSSNEYFGSAGNDVFYASLASNSNFYGGSGTNTFYGGTSSSPNTFYGGDVNASYYAKQAGSLTIDDNGTGGTVYFEHALSSYTRTVDGASHEISFSGNGQTVDTFDVETFAFSNGAGGYTTYTYEELACFLAGTLIRTPEGDVAVEALQPGDLVMTTSGLAKPVLWVGRRAVETHLAHPLTDTPIRIRAHALGLNMPERDLFVSPDHAFLVDGVLVQAGALVNGSTIARPRDLPETFTYYHVELEDHDFLYAEGLPAETFLDNGQRQGFDNAADFPGRARPAEEMDLPRVKSRRQLPKSLAFDLARRLFGGKGDLEQAS